MFGYFIEFDIEVYNRYATLENNLRSASNSFYDSYRATVESFLKYVRNKYNVNTDGRDGIQALLNNDNLLQVLYNAGIEQKNVAKVKDYILKINKHIHKKEKSISFELVVDYLNTLYDFTSPFAYFIGVTPKRISLNEIQGIYSEYQSSLKAQNMFFENIEDHIDKKFEEFKDSINPNSKEKEITPKEARAHFLNTSKKTFVYDADDDSFSVFKVIYTFSLILFLLFGFLQLYLMFADERVMFVYDLPINIVYAILFARFWFVKKEMDPLLLDEVGMYSVMPLGPLWTLDGIKKRYIGFGILTLVISVFDLSMLFDEKVVPVGCIILEIFHTLLMIFLFVYGVINFRKYVLKMSGYDLMTKSPRVDYVR